MPGQLHPRRITHRWLPLQHLHGWMRPLCTWPSHLGTALQLAAGRLVGSC